MLIIMIMLMFNQHNVQRLLWPPWQPICRIMWLSEICDANISRPLGTGNKVWMDRGGGKWTGHMRKINLWGCFFGNGRFLGIHFSRVTFQKRTKQRVAGLARDQALRDETVALIENPWDADIGVVSDIVQHKVREFVREWSRDPITPGVGGGANQASLPSPHMGLPMVHLILIDPCWGGAT